MGAAVKTAFGMGREAVVLDDFYVCHGASAKMLMKTAVSSRCEITLQAKGFGRKPGLFR